jgi:hypothetical protein
MCLVVLTEEESVAGRLQDIIWLARARTKREVGNRRFFFFLEQVIGDLASGCGFGGSLNF